jgi:hypothetical protein
MIYLKSIAGDFHTMRHAVLVEPDLKGLVTNDQELYSMILNCGQATIMKFKDNNPFEFDGEPVKITAKEFCETWRGD